MSRRLGAAPASTAERPVGHGEADSRYMTLSEVELSHMSSTALRAKSPVAKIHT